MKFYYYILNKHVFYPFKNNAMMILINITK